MSATLERLRLARDKAQDALHLARDAETKATKDRQRAWETWLKAEAAFTEVDLREQLTVQRGD